MTRHLLWIALLGAAAAADLPAGYFASVGSLDAGSGETKWLVSSTPDSVTVVHYPKLTEHGWDSVCVNNISTVQLTSDAGAGNPLTLNNGTCSRPGALEVERIHFDGLKPGTAHNLVDRTGTSILSSVETQNAPPNPGNPPVVTLAFQDGPFVEAQGATVLVNLGHAFMTGAEHREVETAPAFRTVHRASVQVQSNSPTKATLFMWAAEDLSERTCTSALRDCWRTPSTEVTEGEAKAVFGAAVCGASEICPTAKRCIGGHVEKRFALARRFFVSHRAAINPTCGSGPQPCQATSPDQSIFTQMKLNSNTSLFVMDPVPSPFVNGGDAVGGVSNDQFSELEKWLHSLPFGEPNTYILAATLPRFGHSDTDRRLALSYEAADRLIQMIRDAWQCDEENPVDFAHEKSTLVLVGAGYIQGSVQRLSCNSAKHPSLPQRPIGHYVMVKAHDVENALNAPKGWLGGARWLHTTAQDPPFSEGSRSSVCITVTPRPPRPTITSAPCSP